MENKPISAPRLNIETKLGTINALFNAKNHVFVLIGPDHYYADSQGNTPFVIRGVEHKGSIHVNIDNGRAYIGKDPNNKYEYYTNIYTKRMDKVLEDSSTKAKDAIGEAVLTALNAFLATPEGKEAVAEAYVYERRERLNSLYRDVEETQKKYNEAITKLRATFREIPVEIQERIIESYDTNGEHAKTATLA